MNAKLQRKLANLPSKPGVYLHKDAQGKILYVGKAKSLRNRVRSYFQAKADHELKTRKMVEKVADLDTIVTRTEVEALLLESNFIKQYKPPYNVVLRDDKHYLFIKITWQDQWPTVTTVRRINDDRGRYFGPYTSAYAVKQSLKTLRKVFPYCTSHDLNTPRQGRHPCFYYQLGLCPGPCASRIEAEEYRRILDGLTRFLDGNTREVISELTRAMQSAAVKQKFEQAAALRDKLRALEQLTYDQQAVDTKLGSRDVIGLARDTGHAVVTLLNIRQGRIVARKQFDFWGTGDASDAEVINSFLGQYYKVATSLPDEVLIPTDVENARLVATFLSQQRGRKVRVHMPQRGNKRSLIQLAEANAANYLRELRLAWVQDEERTEGAAAELTEVLRLPKVPARIECYDISTLSGTSTVGSMVVFTDGRPEKAHYRRFQIRHVKGIDDFAAMQEVLRRRFARRPGLGLARRRPVPDQTSDKPDEVRPDLRKAKRRSVPDESFGAVPDLVIIDGGKGQVSAASQVMTDLGLGEVPLIGLAKRLEEIILLNQTTGEFTVKNLPRDSHGLYLLQRVRDEAHRFAITYNRQMRGKRGVRSALDEIPGIGPVKKKQLMRKFGSVSQIRQAELPEIQAVVGQAAGKVVKDNL